MKLTILHLSDLHLGNDFIPRAIWARRGWWRPVSPELTAGLVEVIRKRREGYVVISGDFVNKAKESTFKHASAYLKSLFQASGFDIQDRLLLIPGNHDVGFFPRKQPDDLWRLRYFREFLRGLFDERDIETRTQRFVKVDVRARVLFLALDTTLKEQAPLAEGEVGKGQIAWAKRKLDDIKRQIGSEFDEYVKIAVMHHHCVPIAGTPAKTERFMQLLDAPDVMALLEEYAFNLVLHGHKHVPHITTQIRTDSGTLTIIGAGTATCPYLEEQATFGNNG